MPGSSIWRHYKTCTGGSVAPNAACIDQATHEMGPWNRIQYPGSQIADPPGSARPAAAALYRERMAARWAVISAPNPLTDTNPLDSQTDPQGHPLGLSAS